MPITSLWSDQEISSKLSARKLRKINIDNVGRAAVLIPIWKEDESLSFLLTLRTKKVQTHKGQISFPGGMRNSTEEPLVQTALRETQEEIGISDNQIRILGQFDEYLSTTKLIVTPFVGRIEPPLVIQKNPEEVEEVLPSLRPRAHHQLHREEEHERERDASERHVRRLLQEDHAQLLRAASPAVAKASASRMWGSFPVAYREQKPTSPAVACATPSTQ